MAQGKSVEITGAALVTGASEGIGYAICTELAQRGFDLVMVSLANERLEEKASWIRSSFGVRVWVLEQNLLEPGAIDAIGKYLVAENIPLQVLVNNAGIGSTAPFLELDHSFYEKQVRLNAEVPVLLTRAMLPVLLRCENPAILNMSSLGSFFHIPGKEVYVATKAMLRSFSHSLRIAYASQGLTVCVVCPGPVDTNPRVRESNRSLKGMTRKTVLQPDEVARVSVHALFRGDHEFIPGTMNRLLLLLRGIIPVWLRDKIVENQFRRQLRGN